MAVEWYAAFLNLSESRQFDVYPIFSYPATGAHSGPLPESGEMDKQQVRFEEIFTETNIVVAFTEFSATGPLNGYTNEYPYLRAASMSMVNRNMEATALAVDHGEMAKMCHLIGDKLDKAIVAEVEFSTGHQMFFDLRYRYVEVDDGQLHADKQGARVINLPSGEVYIAPYEGENQENQTKQVVNSQSCSTKNWSLA
jgi:hypothetical protein